MRPKFFNGKSRKNSISSSPWAWRGSSRSKLYEELGWETLSGRRMSRRTLQIHKIFNNMTPFYLKDEIPPNCIALLSGKIRNTFRTVVCKSNRYLNSFALMQLLSGISLANILMTSNLLITLKNILTRFFVPIPKVFSVYMIL